MTKKTLALFEAQIKQLPGQDDRDAVAAVVSTVARQTGLRFDAAAFAHRSNARSFSDPAHRARLHDIDAALPAPTLLQ